MHQVPLYQKIAEQLRNSIEVGAIPAGSRIASVRTIGKNYQVSALTALNALRLLEKQRWIEARPRSGFYVRQRNDADATSPQESNFSGLGAQTATQLSMLGTPCQVRLDLANGESDIYPIGRLSILMRQLIYRDPGLLGNHVRGTGYLPLKQQIIRRAAEYGCMISPNELIITNGCVESLSLALRAVTRPGDGIAVETPTYFVILQMLRSLGLRIIEIAQTDQGMNLQELECALDRREASVVICVANASNPTGITYSTAHKERLVRLVKQYRATLIEDDIYGDACFSFQRPVPLRALSDEVILCSSFSKTLAPGIRVGWIAGAHWSSAITEMKYTSTMGTSIHSQAAIAEFIRMGAYDVHLRRLRKTLQYRTSQMREAVLHHFPSGTSISSPSGGYVLWVELPQGCINTRKLFERARLSSIGIAPGHLFATDQRFDHCFRLNAGFGWNGEVEHAIATLASLVRLN